MYYDFDVEYTQSALAGLYGWKGSAHNSSLVDTAGDSSVYGVSSHSSADQCKENIVT